MPVRRPGERRGRRRWPSDVGVTDDSVKVGAHFPLTGVAAPGYSEIPTGAQAYFDYVNASGGVHGRKIEYVVKDDAYNPTNTSQVTNELVLKDQVFAMVGGLGTPTHSAVVDFLNDEGVPDLFVSSGSLQWGDDAENRPYTFGWQPDYEIEGKIIGQYVAENMPDAKVGLFLQDDDFGRDAEKGVRRYLDDQIVEVAALHLRQHRRGSADRRAAGGRGRPRARLQHAVVHRAEPAGGAQAGLPAAVVLQQRRLRPGARRLAAGALLRGRGRGRRRAAGRRDDHRVPPRRRRPDDPWVKLWQKVWDAHGGEGELTNYRIYGMSQAYTFVQALQAAGPDPTREGLVEAVEEVGADLEGP